MNCGTRPGMRPVVADTRERDGQAPVDVLSVLHREQAFYLQFTLRWRKAEWALEANIGADVSESSSMLSEPSTRSVARCCSCLWDM